MDISSADIGDVGPVQPHEKHMPPTVGLATRRCE